MKKFTFIAEYKKGTYISQYESSNLIYFPTIAILTLLFLSIFTEKVKAKIQEKVRDNFYSPVSIEKVDNVWCSSYVIFRSLLLLNIVETV